MKLPREMLTTPTKRSLETFFKVHGIDKGSHHNSYKGAYRQVLRVTVQRKPGTTTRVLKLPMEMLTNPTKALGVSISKEAARKGKGRDAPPRTSPHALTYAPPTRQALDTTHPQCACHFHLPNIALSWQRQHLRPSMADGRLRGTQQLSTKGSAAP